MQKMLPFVAVALLAGLAAAALVHRLADGDAAVPPSAGNGPVADPAIDARLRALEQALDEERNARRLLEMELTALLDDFERLAPVAGQNVAAARPAAPGRVDDTTPLTQAEMVQRRQDSRQQALVDAGFAAGRAEWILRRESELRFEAMQAGFEARQSGDAAGMFNARQLPDQLLRAELGDAEFEQYLRAQGRPTSVTVAQVLASSSGEQAGIQPGDRIVRYDGQRVFSTMELMQRTLNGESGGNVVVDLVRDGVPMQMVLPRGPIGIETRNFRGR